ncbi:MAG TPA: VOC family protein [Pseudonocardiaceae bacterium]
MSMATRAGTQSPALHVADSHDLIRVHGARVNNLKDVNVEIPKRRLTVFTGVSGSGKSSLVFDTIAAESQRLINETYSAFVQGFMPTLSRPDVDGAFDEVQADGAEVVQEPTDQPYGIRDCAFRDPAGNLIRIQELS